MAAAKEAAALERVPELSDELYERCWTHSSEKVYTQDDLMGFEVIPQRDLPLLTKCINALTNHGLFKLMLREGRPCWKAVSRADAAKYRGLTDDEVIVLGYIESAGREGIWTKTIRSRSNLHQTTFNRCLKSLESKALIKSTTSSKYPTRKLYILSHLQPLEEVSGGPFYTDGTIDEEFVHQLCLWIEQYVNARSWHFTKAQAPRKRKGIVMTVGEAAIPTTKVEASGPIPMPPGHIGYPKIPEITRAMNEGGLSAVTLKEAEVRQLLDLLCWDGRLIKVMGGQAYKSARIPARTVDGTHNGLVESPCGRCPVFDLCEEGGPVNARSCTYFQKWLEI